jgi:hypothetical protein
MKKNMLLASSFAISLFLLASCKKNDTLGPTPNPNTEDYIVLSGNLATQTLKADKKYLISGQVFVKEGEVLTIEPGTVLYGEKKSKGTLVIERGGKILANGEQNKPIIFTSNQAVGDRDRGDWGGLVILGKAKVNIPNPSIEGIEPQVHYGGSDDDDNSGSLKYVRVEFAGIELTPNNETNGITLGAVGRGTTFENIMVSYGGDDGIEWFGGTVNGKNLVVFATWDDCFDIDNGYSGNLQFGLGLSYPSYADQSESNGFEWDTNGTNEVTDQPTTATVSNFTLIGPAIDGNSISRNFKHGVDLRRRVAANLFNSVVAGFPTALCMNQNTVFPNYESGNATIANNIFLAKTSKTSSGNTDISAADIVNYLTSKNNQINAGADYQTAAAYTALGLNPDWFFGTRINTAYPAHPSFVVNSGTIASGANFSYAAFNETNRANAFDKTVNFLGAFGSNDWTQGWTNFDPINSTY